MTTDFPVRLAIYFNDPELDAEDRDEQASLLIAELSQMDEITSVNRVIDQNIPENSKALGSFLVGLLTAEINADNTQKLFAFLGNRLRGRAIELSVEAHGKKLTVKAHSQEELEAAMKAAKNFIS